MFEKFIIPIIVTVIGAIVVELILRGINKESPLSRLMKSTKIKYKLRKSKHSTTTNKFIESDNKLVNKFFSFLESDIEQEGFHRGQFGFQARTKEEMRYQTGKESLQTKPRLYLTGVPVFILLKHKDRFKIDPLMHLVKDGMLALLNDCWVRVGMGAKRFTDPLGTRISESDVISYRHTIRTAQILLSIDHNLNMPKVLLGKMLDPTSDMQVDTGGWRQCNTEFREEDLWGSAYAASFLESCIQKADLLSLNKETVNKAKKALDETLSWLFVQWKKNQWEYGKVPSEENSTSLFCEIVRPILNYRIDILKTVIEKFRTYLDPLYQPSSSYLDATKLIGEFSASIRLAYVFFLIREHFKEATNICNTLKNNALQHLESGYTCADAAMTIDILLA